MNIKEKIVSLKNSAIDFILKRLESPLQLPTSQQQLDSYNYGNHVALSTLSPEERNKAFIEFAEGNEDLYTLLTTAYEHGIESMFSCSGHGVDDLGYVVFRVTDDNLKKLQQLGKVLSHEGVSTNFEYHNKFGFQVAFRPFKTEDASWFSKATAIIKNPPIEEVTPTIYYHETPTSSYTPFSQKLKQNVIDTLKTWRSDLQPTKHSTDVNSLESTSIPQTFNEKLRAEFPVQNSNTSTLTSKEVSNKLGPEANVNTDFELDDNL